MSAAGERDCPHCGESNAPDVDFCHNCQRYLAWDGVTANGSRTRVAAGGRTESSSTGVITGAARRVRQEKVTLELLRADRQEADGRLALGVPAGGRVLFYGRVRNTSEIVDSYTLRVEGLPDGWWTIEEPTAYLLPVVANEGFEAEIEIAVHPPRSWEAEARAWEFTVVVASEKEPSTEKATAAVIVSPFSGIEAAVRPSHIAGRGRASMYVGVYNAGNSTASVLLDAIDSAGACVFEVPPGPYEVGRGQIGEVPVGVRPRKPHWIGRPIEHRLDFVARAAHDPELKAHTQAAYSQRAWIPWWLPLALVFLVLVAILLWLLWPDRVKVPDVRKQPNAFAAQERLEKKGLTLNPKVRTRLQPRTASGTVIAQAPAPGKTVDKGRRVTLVVAAGHRLVRVPKLKGLKIADADERLKDGKLSLGAVQPKLAPRLVVKSQVPHAGARRKTGTPVAVVLGKPKAKPNPKGDPGSDEPAGGGGGGAGAVPAVKPGATAADAKKRIKAAGLTPVVELVIDPEPRGTVLRTEPPKGEKPADKIVTLVVSAGFPQVAYDNGTDALAVEGATGMPVDGISRRAAVASRGAWTPDGRRVAYASGDDLFLVAPGGDALRVPTGGRRVLHPAFAPLLSKHVLVFATPSVKHAPARPGDHPPQVCWMELTRRPFAGPDCLTVDDSTTRIDGFAWSPRGSVLLVAVQSEDGFGLLRLATRSPFSPDPTQWAGSQELFTHADAEAQRGVRAAAFSPDGKRVAVVSNLNRSGAFTVSVVPQAKVASKKFEDSSLLGCDVDWRPDGAELLVVQAGLTCAGELGSIVRTPLANPLLLRTVALVGAHPSYQPIGLSPGPARAPVRGTRP